MSSHRVALVAEGHHPLPAALADDPQGALAQIDLGNGEPYQLRHAQPRRIQELEHRAVSNPARYVRIGGVNQCLHLGFAQQDWQPTTELWRLDSCGWILDEAPVADLPLVEPPQGRQASGDGSRCGLGRDGLGGEKFENVGPTRLD